MSETNRMRYQIAAPILSHERVADSEYEIVVQAPEIAQIAQPGHFLQVLYDQSYNPFTRRPFSVYHVDREKGTLAIVYLARGVFTQGMRGQRPGETLSIVGPLGNAFTPDPRPDARHILVGGGVGLPPLYFLALEMLNQRIAKPTVINGARSTDLLVGVDELKALDVDLRITTDDGSLGQQGRVTDALKPLLDEFGASAHVYACGPTAMLRAVGDMCIEAGAPCDISVETMMPCGMGVCMGCVVKKKDPASETGFQYVRSCYEGPIFAAENILWE